MRKTAAKADAGRMDSFPKTAHHAAEAARHESLVGLRAFGLADACRRLRFDGMCSAWQSGPWVVPMLLGFVMMLLFSEGQTIPAELPV